MNKNESEVEGMSTWQERRGALSWEEADRCDKSGFKGAWAHLSTDEETLMAPWPGQWLPMEALPRQAEDAGRGVLFYVDGMSTDFICAAMTGWFLDGHWWALGVDGEPYAIATEQASGWAPVVLPRKGGAT